MSEPHDRPKPGIGWQYWVAIVIAILIAPGYAGAACAWHAIC